ncbi:MAG: glycosyltransferase [Desulfobacterales bacterium]|nr:glycosyltransferase [Desulfobacterales bacterium]
MKHLKIAIVNEICTAGAARCARDLENHLSERHTVKYYPRQEKETAASIFKDLDLFSPDVVHCHSYYGDLPYSFLSRLSHRFPTCFTPHDPRPIGTMHPTCWDCPEANTCISCPLVGFRKKLVPNYFLRFYKRWVHLRAKKTLRIVTPSRWFQKRLMNSELHRFTIDYIPNGIDLEHFQPIANARSNLDIAEKEKIILYVAHSAGWKSNYRKGLTDLADAFVNEILPKHPATLLMVAGEGLVPNHPNVMPIGFIPQEKLPLYYSAADMLAVPSLADNLPYTILEAMACQLPVVAAQVGGIPEQVENTVNGYLYPKSDCHALADAIISLLESPEKRMTMGRAGRNKASRRYSMVNFIRRYEAIYEQLATAIH